ncbi:MAG: T9SS type A sorting domain-containing protein, partial [Bacteroidales bacterium]
ELIAFRGSAGQDHNLLQWSTATESNNDYFTLERSENGKDFTPIKTIKGAGNSNEIIDYQTKDYNITSGISYYRLKQTDYNGMFDYSDIIDIKREHNLRWSLQLCNHNNNLSVKLINLQGGPLQLEIYNMQGKIIHAKRLPNTESFLNIPLNIHAANGIYFLRILHDKQFKVKKITL